MCSEIEQLAKNNQPLLDKLTQITKKDVDLWNLWSVYDAWFIDRENKRTLPDGFTDALFQQTRDLNDRVDDFDYGIGIKPFKNFDIQTELIKLRSGFLLNSLIDHMQAKIYCQTTPYANRGKQKTINTQQQKTLI